MFTIYLHLLWYHYDLSELCYGIQFRSETTRIHLRNISEICSSFTLKNLKWRFETKVNIMTTKQHLWAKSEHTMDGKVKTRGTSSVPNTLGRQFGILPVGNPPVRPRRQKPRWTFSSDFTFYNNPHVHAMHVWFLFTSVIVCHIQSFERCLCFNLLHYNCFICHLFCTNIYLLTSPRFLFRPTAFYLTCWSHVTSEHSP
jgi:hypothetical protein